MIGFIETVYGSITLNVVHPTFFPFLIAQSLHAARISMAFQINVRKSQNSSTSSRTTTLSWGQYIVGFLIMAWSGTIQTHFLLSIPPPYIYTVYPWINYISIHLALTAIFQLFPTALSPRVFDTLLFFPDAILRTASISFALDLVQIHPDPRLANSLFLRILIGAIASSGGSMTAATLGVWTPDWAFSTPVFLRKGTTMLSTLDIWSGSLAGCVYGLLLASHPSYRSLITALTLTDKQQQVGPLVSPLGARAAAVVVLTLLYAWRVWRTHWVTSPVPSKQKSD